MAADIELEDAVTPAKHHEATKSVTGSFTPRSMTEPE